MAVIVMIAACKSVPKGDAAIVTAAKEINKTEGIVFKVDTNKSNIEWIGTKPDGRHHGTLSLKEGEVLVENDKVAGGHFMIDINTLKPDDQKAKGNKMLQRHLLSDDFFDVVQFPVAKFIITGIRIPDPGKKGEYLVSGNLELKTVTKNISFPACIRQEGQSLTADALFNMDRTLWDMHYGSGKGIGDWLINPQVNIKLHLVAHR